MHWSHFIVLVTLSASCAQAQYNITDFILGFGYPCEDHLAPTADGWKLSMQRIPHGKTSNGGTLGVVLFQHGLTDDSAGVCLNGPQESLPFILADAGYDVWLGNNRGNGQSMINTNYNAGQAEFWDFSWADMAEYDMPAQINYVLQATGAQKLAYIGHSEGTTQAFAGLLNPDVSSKVSVFIALAPAVFVSHTRSPVVRVLADLPTIEVFNLLGVNEFALPNFIHSILPDVCTLFPSLCAFDLELIMGPTTFLNASRIQMYANWEPNPTSVKNMAHWAQMVNTGNYCQFDYGTQGNMQHYNQATPPCYDLSTFPDIPVFIFAGGDDYLADPVDVTQLIGALPYPPVVYEIADYAHADFILGYNANQRIFPSIIKILGSQM